MNAVRLLLDENISEALAVRLMGAFENSLHVRIVLGPGATDEEVWCFARNHALILVTRDADFERLSVSRGVPPKVIWIDRHNATTAILASLILDRRQVIERFIADPDAAFLALRGV